MSNAGEFMQKVSNFLISKKSSRCTHTNDEIRAVCEKVRLLLTRWDVILAIAHTDDPVESDFEKAEKYLDQCSELSDEMGFSRTPTNYGEFAPLLKQMRMVPGGLFDFNKS